MLYWWPDKSRIRIRIRPVGAAGKAIWPAASDFGPFWTHLNLTLLYETPKRRRLIKTTATNEKKNFFGAAHY